MELDHEGLKIRERLKQIQDIFNFSLISQEREMNVYKYDIVLLIFINKGKGGNVFKGAAIIAYNMNQESNRYV